MAKITAKKILMLIGVFAMCAPFISMPIILIYVYTIGSGQDNEGLGFLPVLIAGLTFVPGLIIFLIGALLPKKIEVVDNLKKQEPVTNIQV